MSTIQFPNPERMMEHQKEVLWLDNHRFKVLIWHRRARKTTTAINELVKQALMSPGPYWHVFPTYTEAKDAIWRDPQMLFGIVPPQIIKKRNEQELIIYLANGSYIQLIGADNPDRLRGAGPLGVVLDEYDTMKDDVWPTIEPILRANDGWAWFVGTPKGKGKLFKAYNMGQNPDNKEWKSWLLKASTSGIISPDQLVESRKTMTEAFYNQEWECEFQEGEGSVFRNVRDVCVAEPKAPVQTHRYLMGVDLAKVQDYTVIVIYDRDLNKQVYQDRFQTLEWPFQKERIKEIAKHYNNATVAIDATGLGDPIADDLIRAGIDVDPIKITGENKKDMIQRLSIWIERRKIKMLPIPETLLEFDNFSYEISGSGRILYGARQGAHDDIVMAHALAVYRLQDIVLDYKNLELPPVQRFYLDQINKDARKDETNDWEAVN